MKTRLTLPEKLEAVEDRHFSYVHFPKHDDEAMPVIVARDLEPEYATLFAAAPELLKALRSTAKALAEASRELDRRGVDAITAYSQQIELARAVIAKAEGRK